MALDPAVKRGDTLKLHEDARGWFRDGDIEAKNLRDVCRFLNTGTYWEVLR